MAADDQSGKKSKIELLPPLTPLDPLPPLAPCIQSRPPIPDMIPTLPDVQVRGRLFEIARIERLTRLIDRNARGYDAVKRFWQTYAEAVYADITLKRTLERHKNLDAIIHDDNEEFKLEMEQNERRRKQIRQQWKAEDAAAAAGTTQDPSATKSDAEAARDRKNIHDLIMKPQQVKEYGEDLIRQFIRKRGGEDKLTDKDRKEIERMRAKIEAYTIRMQESEE